MEAIPVQPKGFCYVHVTGAKLEGDDNNERSSTDGGAENKKKEK